MQDYDGRVLEDPKGPWRLLCCLDCGFVSTFPRPTPARLREAYPDDYFTHTDFDLSRLPLHKRVRLYVFRGYYDPRRGALQRAIGRVLHSALNAIEPTTPLALLDVGCGAGKDLALYGSSGWEVTGLEVDPRAVELARAKDLNVVQGSITDDVLPLPLGHFGAIQMRHSLEHFHDPSLALRRAHDMLAPRGRLLVIVPNIGSADFRLFRSSWFHLNLPQHVSHFSKASLLRMLQSEQFEVLHTGGHVLLYGCFMASLKALRLDLSRERVGRLSRFLVLAKVTVGVPLAKLGGFLAYHLHLTDEPSHLYAIKVDARRMERESSH